MLYHGEHGRLQGTQGTHKYILTILCLHGEHGHLQGTQGTHKYILTILCLVLGHVISWRTWTPTRNSRHTQVHINYLVFGARPCYIMENMDAYKELKAHTSTYIYYLVFGARPCYIMENMDTYKELKAHTSTY